MDIVLETERLGKRYGRTWALQECSLHVPAGRVAALVGPNGAGKSTLLHLAVGLLRPDAGTVRVFDSAPYDNTAALAEIGFVAQDTPLYRDFTAVELITMGAKLNRRWPATGSPSSASHQTVRSASYPADSERRSRSHSPWRSVRGCCCSTSRSPGWIRSPGGSSCSP